MVYLDTGASALKPQCVIDAMNTYYAQYGVNIHRGMYPISDQATIVYEQSRDTVARFINAESNEIIVTSGTTHGLNMLSYIVESEITSEHNIVITRMEHHANMIPWQKLCARTGASLRYIELTDDLCLDMDSARHVIDNHTKIVAFTSLSNVLGTIVPSKELIDLAHSVGAYAIIDGAQGIVHQKIDVKELDCDFLVFSGHKLYGPTGVGIVYGKKEHLERLEPFFTGGDMIKYVTYQTAEWTDIPHKFEAGTPPIAELIGLGKAIQFVEEIGWENIVQHEHELTAYALEKLSGIVRIIGPNSEEKQSGVISFLVGDLHPHDVGDLLGQNNIAVRVGHHCAMPLIQKLGIVGTVRASFGVYNTKEDVDTLIEGICKTKKIFT